MDIFEEIAVLSKAMSDSNRVKIVTLIQRDKKVCVCEICDTLALSQPLVSRHLKQLKNANVLDSYKEGKWVMYVITQNKSHLLQHYLDICQINEKLLNRLQKCSIR
ncbi:MAG: metalloregulator ArsR/SmtB family transcription factor [Sulfurovum sp.]|nr:metalloregulator ArsR/SmtB family transcription factor [Sulfurovum sp.]